MNIQNISEIEGFSKSLKQDIKRVVLKSAYQIQEKAKKILTTKIPKASKNTSKLYNDTLAEGIYVGKLYGDDDKIKITSMGSQQSGSGTFRTRFFVGGTKNRYVQGGYRKTKTGIKYVKYKKPMSTGEINPTDAISQAVNSLESKIHENFKNIQNDK